MKKLFLSFIVPAVIICGFPCCFSCTQPAPEENEGEVEPPVDKPDPPTPEPEGPKAGEYTLVFPDAANGTSKTGWEEGDQIYFHGNYSTSAKTITLKASDITDGGKKAKVDVDEKMLEFLCSPDGLYAAYPAEAVEPGDGLMDSDFTFKEWDRLLMLAYMNGTQFVFRSVTAVMHFTVSGDYDSYALGGVGREGVRVIRFNPDYTSAKEAFNAFSTDGYPYRYGSVAADGSTVNTLFFPGGIRLKNGYYIFLGKNGQYTKVFTVEGDQNIQPGDVVELGDITSGLADYDGPAPKMPEMGERTKYTVKFNELSGLCLSVDNDFLWGVDDNGGLGKFSFEGEVLYKKSYGGEWEAVTIDPATGDLLIGNEEPVSIYRIEAPEYDKRTKLFDIPGTSGFGNAGLEGLTYYKDGLVYAGMQTGSWLFCCSLETGEVVWKKEMRKIFPVITEIADLYYDSLTDWLWIIDSESKRFFALTGDAETMLGYYTMKGTDNPEAICVDHQNSCIWVGDDYGSTSYIYKYAFTGLDDFIIGQPK